MNSMARATLDAKTGSYSFPKKLAKEATLDMSIAKAVADIIGGSGLAAGVGLTKVCAFAVPTNTQLIVMTELISAIPSHNPTFVAHNFTSSEIAYCNSQVAPCASFAARWTGKEAAFNVPSKGTGVAMQDIEILPNAETGAPEVTLHGNARKAADGEGIKQGLISLSHSEVCLNFFLLLFALKILADCCHCICASPNFVTIL